MANGVGTFIGNVLNAIGGGGNIAQQQKYNYDMYLMQRGDNRYDAAKAFERQLYLNDRQQRFELETSDPKFQMSRMRAAGINPNLIAGQISPAVNTPSVPTAPQASPSSPLAMSSMDTIGNGVSTLLSLFTGVQGMFKTDKEIKKLSIDTEQVAKQLQLTEAQTAKVKSETELLVNDLNELRPRQLKKLDEDTKEVISRYQRNLQDFKQNQQIFPEQLLKLYYDTQNAYELLEQSKVNTNFIKKRFERFEKSFEKIVALDQSQLTAAANQSQSAANSSNAMRQFINSIDAMVREWANDNPDNQIIPVLGNGLKLILNWLANNLSSHMSIPNILPPSDK